MQEKNEGMEKYYAKSSLPPQEICPRRLNSPRLLIDSGVDMKHTIELQPFTVPNFVRPVSPIGKREDGWKETPAIPLSELSSETLKAMCDEFVRSVFIKSGKTPP